jgi:hypothetical protein
MARTIKCRTVLVSSGDRLTAYRSVEEVPVEIRRRFLDRTGDLRTATILIADRKGREELLRASAENEAVLETRQFTPALWVNLRPWVEGAVLCALGAAVWALIALR